MLCFFFRLSREVLLTVNQLMKRTRLSATLVRVCLFSFLLSLTTSKGPKLRAGEQITATVLSVQEDGACSLLVETSERIVETTSEGSSIEDVEPQKSTAPRKVTPSKTRTPTKALASPAKRSPAKTPAKVKRHFLLSIYELQNSSKLEMLLKQHLTHDMITIQVSLLKSLKMINMVFNSRMETLKSNLERVFDWLMQRFVCNPKSGKIFKATQQ